MAYINHPTISFMDYLRLEFKDMRNEVHVWAVDLDNLKLPCNETVQMLPEFERQKSERFRFETHKTRYIKGHYLLRALLGRYLCADFYDQEFQINRYGKPTLINTQSEDSIYFNMSNSENACICVFRQHGDIGVDIEKIQNLPDMNSIVERFFSPLEKKIFHSLQEYSRKKTFFTYWTRKEALLKGMGLGLSFPLDKVDVINDQEKNSETFIKTTEPNMESGWRIKDINVFEGFASAIAFEGNHSDSTLQFQYFQLA